MKIISWNVNGIRAVWKKGFLDFLETEKPEILCLQETKISEDLIDKEMINPNGYETIYNSAEKKGYSGTSTFYKTRPLASKTKFDIDIFNGEGRIVETEYENFILYNVYFPNGQKDENRLNYKLKFYDEFLKYTLDMRRLKQKGIIITGDFNTAHTEIDLKNPKENENYSGFLPIERAWIDKYIEAGFTDFFRKLHPGEKDHYTWWTYRFGARAKNVGWRIDYFMITDEIIPMISDCGILKDVEGSDHCPIYLSLK
jgi:exodeoxyribonuclease III